MTLPTPGNEVRVTLSWPSKDLSPNARVHWARKARATAVARNDAAWSCWVAGVKRHNAEATHVSMTFCPPDKRRRDLDNCISSTKAHRDGIADALGIDDSKFITTYRMGEPVKGGAVHVTLRGA